jgi:hypothetical protein
MKKAFKYQYGLLMIFLSQPLFAQSVEMADTLRTEGKIYVVVAIIMIILLGFIGYLFVQDRKLSRIEKFFENKNQTK